MVFLRKIAGFADQESGAVTVDWVVLTAALVLIGVAAVAIYKPALMSSSSDISGVVMDAGSAINPVATT